MPGTRHPGYCYCGMDGMADSGPPDIGGFPTDFPIAPHNHHDGSIERIVHRYFFPTAGITDDSQIGLLLYPGYGEDCRPLLSRLQARLEPQFVFF